LNINKQLHEKGLKKLVKLQQLKGNPKADVLIDKFIDAGIRVFLIGMAGLPLENPKLLLEEKDEQISELKDKVERLEKELRPVIDVETSVYQHLKLLGLKDRKLTRTILGMITTEENHRFIKVPKFDRISKQGFEDDLYVNTGTVYATF